MHLGRRPITHAESNGGGCEVFNRIGELLLVYMRENCKRIVNPFLIT